MAVDTPARIAILGAGPIGLEAALYARFLGYDVDIYERGEVAEHVLRWGHVRMFSPWSLNVTSLGVAALQAQEERWQLPADDKPPTGREFAEKYLLPLAGVDLLADSIHTKTEVVSLGHETLRKGELIGDDTRADDPFRILLHAEGEERIATADVIIDSTGTFGTPNWAGRGGLPAIGERAVRDAIEYRLPDLHGAERDKYAGRRVLVVGSGYSAATNIVALAKLAAEHPDTHLTWITRHGAEAGPIARFENDALPERDRLAARANELALADDSPVNWLPETLIDAFKQEADGTLKVRLAGKHERELVVDRVLANVGFRPQTSLYEELHVHTCYASEGPMNLATTLLGETSGDCLAQPQRDAATLVNPEPDFYILGAKSYGRNSRFLISTGHGQIRDLFTIIGDRPTLDLYANTAHLLST